MGDWAFSHQSKICQQASAEKRKYSPKNKTKKKGKNRRKKGDMKGKNAQLTMKKHIKCCEHSIYFHCNSTANCTNIKVDGMERYRI